MGAIEQVPLDLLGKEKRKKKKNIDKRKRRYGYY